MLSCSLPISDPVARGLISPEPMDPYLLEHVDRRPVSDSVTPSTDFPTPDDVRPCCAFGVDQSVSMADVPLPFIVLPNAIELSELGQHAFNSGLLDLGLTDGAEKNGLIYTLRGGVIDTAHVRDTSDLTVSLFHQIYPNLGAAYTLVLPGELGKKTIQLYSFDVSNLPESKRIQLAADMASTLAYENAVFHEIGQSHGYRSVAIFPELISAYSPEDLYSNNLGAHIARKLILSGQANTLNQYNESMTRTLLSTLHHLQALLVDETKAVIKATDGHWWNSNERVPNKYFVLKRNYHGGYGQSPLVVPTEYIGNIRSPALRRKLLTQAPAVTLSLPSRSQGLQLEYLAKLQMQVDEEYYPSFSHVPKEYWLRGIDFALAQYVIQFDEIANNKEMRYLGIGSP